MIDIQNDFNKILLPTVFLGVCIFMLSPKIAHAEVENAITHQAPSPQASQPPVTSVKKIRNSKGKYVREKEAEGSEARDRFQADTVIKSKYEQDGQALEVDPD